MYGTRVLNFFIIYFGYSWFCNRYVYPFDIFRYYLFYTLHTFLPNIYVLFINKLNSISLLNLVFRLLAKCGGGGRCSSRFFLDWLRFRPFDGACWFKFLQNYESQSLSVWIKGIILAGCKYLSIYIIWRGNITHQKDNMWFN